MASVWDVIVEDFSDLPDLAGAARVCVRLGLAAILGGAIGYERERKGKGAGLRTHMLVAVGSALVILMPVQAHMNGDATSRVIQGLLAGIGFLGAGTIMQLPNENRVRGLTTAAGLWLTAAIGIAAGLGREATAVLSTGLALVILALLPRFEREMHENGHAAPPSAGGTGS